jgi:hypothetical protein
VYTRNVFLLIKFVKLEKLNDYIYEFSVKTEN